jgi:hypothetical protein
MPSRLLTLLGAVLAAQLLLAGALLLRPDPLAAARPNAPLIAGDLKNVDQVRIEGNAAAAGQGLRQVVLSRHAGSWSLDNSDGAPADAARLQRLLTTLAGLKRGLPVATTHAALARFKVAESQFQRRLTLRREGRLVATLYFGDSPGLHQSYGRTAQDENVYAVGLPVDELPVAAGDWLDQSVVTVATDRLTALQITSGAGRQLVLQKHGSGGARPGGAAESWQALRLPAGRQLDVGHVDALLRTLGTVRVSDVLGRQPRPEWQLARPQLSLQFDATGAPPTTWTIAKPRTGEDYVLKSSAQPWYFGLSSYEARSLLDASAASALLTAPAGSTKRK